MGKWYKLTDKSEMPFGKHKGVSMVNIPCDYLLWLYKDGEMTRGNVRDYIEENLQAIKQNWNL